jgi:hypothetical protein
MFWAREQGARNPGKMQKKTKKHDLGLGPQGSLVVYNDA